MDVIKDTRRITSINSGATFFFPESISFNKALSTKRKIFGDKTSHLNLKCTGNKKQKKNIAQYRDFFHKCPVINERVF